MAAAGAAGAVAAAGVFALLFVLDHGVDNEAHHSQKDQGHNNSTHKEFLSKIPGGIGLRDKGYYTRTVVVSLLDSL